ncbi:MAG TPA: (2Fe-2S) ferredoxin domain-containing protein [Thermoanaerobaculia bacterium]|nr:(2Fe-2S) ferredoxin domain-containing protein [Thermoanaerobaculia bacterium]
MKYPFETLFLVCTGARCNDASRGKDRGEEIRAELKDLNKKLGRKPTARICAVSCLDLCDYGPNIVVHPDGTVYSGLDVKSALRVYRGVMGDEEKAEDKELRIENSDFRKKPAKK